MRSTYINIFVSFLLLIIGVAPSSGNDTKVASTPYDRSNQEQRANVRAELNLLVPTESPGSDCEVFVRINKITDVTDCTASDLQPLSKVDGSDYYYNSYCINSHSNGHGDSSYECDISGVGIYFKDNSPKFKLLSFQMSSNANLDRPEIVENIYGYTLAISGSVPGSGHGREDSYYHYDDRQKIWTPIEDTWGKDLLKLLPSGSGVWKGVVLDLKTMTAKTPVWGEHDSNCCPTEGTAHIKLGIEDNHFVIESYELKATYQDKFDKASVYRDHYFNEKQYDQAIIFATQAISIANNRKDKESAKSQLAYITYDNYIEKAKSCKEQKNYEGAISFATKALEIAISRADKEGKKTAMVHIYINTYMSYIMKSDYYGKQRNYEQAISFATKAVTIAKDSESKEKEAKYRAAYSNDKIKAIIYRGKMHLAFRKVDAAKNDYRSACKLGDKDACNIALR